MLWISGWEWCALYILSCEMPQYLLELWYSPCVQSETDQDGLVRELKNKNKIIIVAYIFFTFEIRVKKTVTVQDKAKKKNPKQTHTTQIKTTMLQILGWSRAEKERDSCMKRFHETSQNHDSGHLHCLLKACQLEALRLLAYSPVAYTLILRSP